ncbi:mitogen-activated protein kinase kinase kinase 19 isoform X1 [Petromyzon marinus]|uniref:mitogen-activated protein kinase kinase kinase 19 isoform X1 n=2 Tax=Petromyzon marinus TaxID=7757 RepID=UPI003F7094F8
MDRVELRSAQDGHHEKPPAWRAGLEQESRGSARPVAGAMQTSPTNTSISIRVTMRDPCSSSLKEAELGCTSDGVDAGKMDLAPTLRALDGHCRKAHSRQSGNNVAWELGNHKHQTNVCLPPIRSASLPLPPPLSRSPAEGSRSLPTLGLSDPHPRSRAQLPNVPVWLRPPSMPKKCFSPLPEIHSKTYAEANSSAVGIRRFCDTPEDCVTNKESADFVSPRKSHFQGDEVNVRRYRTFPSFSQTHQPRLWSFVPGRVQHMRPTVTQALLPGRDFGVRATAHGKNHPKDFESHHDDEGTKTTPKHANVEHRVSDYNGSKILANDAKNHGPQLNQDMTKTCLNSSAVNELVPIVQALHSSSKAITPATKHEDAETLSEPRDHCSGENVQRRKPNGCLKNDSVTVEDKSEVCESHQTLCSRKEEVDTEPVKTELNAVVLLGVNSAVSAGIKVVDVKKRTYLSSHTDDVKATAVNRSVSVRNRSQCQPAAISPDLIENTVDKNKPLSYTVAFSGHLLATTERAVPKEQLFVGKNKSKEATPIMTTHVPTPPLRCSCQHFCHPTEASETRQERGAGVTSGGNGRDSLVNAENEDGAKVSQKPESRAEVVGSEARPGKQGGPNGEAIYPLIRVWKTEIEESLVKNAVDVNTSSTKNALRKGLRKTSRAISSGVTAEKSHKKYTVKHLRTPIKSPCPSSPQHEHISPNILGIPREGMSQGTQVTKARSAKKHLARHSALKLKLHDDNTRAALNSWKPHIFLEKLGPPSMSAVDFAKLNYDDLFSESARKDVQTPAIWQMFTGAVYVARRQTKPLQGPVRHPRSVSAGQPKSPANARPRGRNVKLHSNEGRAKKLKPKLGFPSRQKGSPARAEQNHARSKSVDTNGENRKLGDEGREDSREKIPVEQEPPARDKPQLLGTLKEDTFENCRNDFTALALQTFKREPLIEKPDWHTSGSQGVSGAASLSDDATQDQTITWIKGNRLGKGAFGTVFLGLTNQGKLIAVKELELRDAQSANGNQGGQKQSELQKLQDEVELLTTLHHPNVVEYLGTEMEGNRFSIFMEFVPGGTVAETVRGFGPLGESVCRSYIAQMTRGLAYLHGHGVMHGDVKGSNAVITPAGVVKLIDFGCAQRVALALSCHENGGLHSVHGTAYWMAPEVINGTGYARRADVWSLGCTLHEMAVGRPPFADMAPMAALLHIGIRNGIMPGLPQAFSKEAQEFVEQCFIRDKLKRPSSQELLSHPFICEEPCAR